MATGQDLEAFSSIDSTVGHWFYPNTEMPKRIHSHARTDESPVDEASGRVTEICHALILTHAHTLILICTRMSQDRIRSDGDVELGPVSCACGVYMPVLLLSPTICPNATIDTDRCLPGQLFGL